LHRAFRDAVRWGRLSSNPGDDADSPKLKGTDRREMKTWTAKQLRALLDSRHGERLGHTTVSITLDTCSHAIPAMEEEAAALSAGLVFAAH
jgi:hypothetical protein